mgnify:FL=1
MIWPFNNDDKAAVDNFESKQQARQNVVNAASILAHFLDFADDSLANRQLLLTNAHGLRIALQKAQIDYIEHLQYRFTIDKLGFLTITKG